MSKEAEYLAENHWEYLKALLEAHGEEDEFIEVIGFHYKSAMIHGYKHGRDYEAMYKVQKRNK